MYDLSNKTFVAQERVYFIKLMFSETDVKFVMFVLGVDATGSNFALFRVMDSM